LTLRRGFKSEAERIASELRAELDLSPLDKLDPAQLAEHLGIPVFGLSEIGRFDGARGGFIHVLQNAERDTFSARTVFVGERRLIIHNDSHAPTRQASNVTHELSHCVLEHPPSPVLSPEGCRNWNSQFEEEADWLAGALLIPREGAVWCQRATVPPTDQRDRCSHSGAALGRRLVGRVGCTDLDQAKLDPGTRGCPGTATKRVT
jgi:Zn-dependent peptidase ImmA (M78 family)